MPRKSAAARPSPVAPSAALALPWSPSRLAAAVLLGAPAGAEKVYNETLDGAKRSLKTKPKDAALWTLAGRCLVGLGRAKEGFAAFEKALGADPEHGPAFQARAEAWLLAGRSAEALADLDKAVAADAGPWALALKAAARLRSGDADGARADLAAARKDRETEAWALAVEGLLEAGRGRRPEAAALMERSLQAGGGGWVRALRGALRRDAGDFRASLEDFDAAYAEEPTAWVLSQRADALNRAGFYPKALADLERMAELLPAAAEPHVQAANIYFDQALYPQALASMEKAAELRPADASIRARLSRFFFVLCRWEEAQAQADEACRLTPADVQRRFERLQLLGLRRKEEQAFKELDRAPLGAPLDDYLRGYLRIRQRRYKEAEAHFERAASQSSGSLGERAAFYAMVARTLEHEGPETGGPPLTLCSIGIRHPYQTSVRTLRVLAASDLLFNNIGDPLVAEFLGLFPGEIRAVVRRLNEPAARRAEQILDWTAELKPGQTGAFVTRIHPFIYRRISYDLVEVGRERGMPFQAFAAFSLTESSWGLAPGSEADPAALQVFAISELLRRPDLFRPQLPAVIYAIAPDDTRRRLIEHLKPHFPPQHPAFLLPGAGDHEDKLTEGTMGAIEKLLIGADGGAVVFIPALKEGRHAV